MEMPTHVMHRELLERATKELEKYSSCQWVRFDAMNEEIVFVAEGKGELIDLGKLSY